MLSARTDPAEDDDLVADGVVGPGGAGPRNWMELGTLGLARSASTAVLLKKANRPSGARRRP